VPVGLVVYSPCKNIITVQSRSEINIWNKAQEKVEKEEIQPACVTQESHHLEQNAVQN
jgi:hypothetical protein